MSIRIYANETLREWWDDDSRTITTYDDAGTVISTRPYTAAENAEAGADHPRLRAADRSPQRLRQGRPSAI